MVSSLCVFGAPSIRVTPVRMCTGEGEDTSDSMVASPSDFGQCDEDGSQVPYLAAPFTPTVILFFAVPSAYIVILLPGSGGSGTTLRDLISMASSGSPGMLVGRGDSTSCSSASGCQDGASRSLPTLHARSHSPQSMNSHDAVVCTLSLLPALPILETPPAVQSTCS